MLMSKEEIPDIFRTLVRLLNNASTNRAVQVDVGEGFVFHRRELDVLLMVGDKPGISQSAIAQNIGNFLFGHKHLAYFPTNPFSTIQS